MMQIGSSQTPIPDALWRVLASADVREGLVSRSARIEVDPGGRVLFANVAGLRALRCDTLQGALGRPLLTLAPKLRTVLQASRALRVGQSVKAGAYTIRRRAGMPARLSLEADGPGSGLLRDGPSVADLEARLGLGSIRLSKDDALAGRARRDGAVRSGGRAALDTPHGILVIGEDEPAEKDEAAFAWRLGPDDTVLSGPDALRETLGGAALTTWLSEKGAGDAPLAEALRTQRAFTDVACLWPLAPGAMAPARVSARPIMRPDGTYRGLRGETRITGPAPEPVAPESEAPEAVAKRESLDVSAVDATEMSAAETRLALAAAEQGVPFEVASPILTAADAGAPSDLIENTEETPDEPAVEDTAQDEAPARLSADERDAFDQIADMLSRNGHGFAGPMPEVANAPARSQHGNEADTLKLEEMLAQDDAVESDARALHEELDAVPLALIVYRDADVLFLNKAAGRMLGYGSADELAVHGGVEALFGDEAEQGRAAIPTRRVLRADGSGLDLVTALRTIRWRGATAFMLTLRTPDVSDGDNEAPPTLPADALLDILPLGVLSLAGDGTVHSANAKAGELLGLDVDGLIGASLTALLCEPHRRDVLDDLHALMRGELRPARPVIGLGSAQTAARQAPEAARAAPDLDLTLRRLDLGGGYGLVALLQDARQRKADQEARARAEAELSRLHKERGAFLKRISHELRTPLNAIVGFSEVMMEERFGTLGSVRYRDYAHDIQESGRRLIGMIGDLMDLVRLQEGQDAEESGDERIALNEIVTACVSNVYGRAGERRVIIRCSLAQGLPPVRADRESLSQIVSNLLDNSVRLTQPGGQVIVSTSPLEDGGVAVRVRDGARLDAAALKAAVSPFDLELETTPADGAPSLGLPLTRALAQANGADFTIDSEAGRGTVTQVLFPPERVIAA